MIGFQASWAVTGIRLYIVLPNTPLRLDLCEVDGRICLAPRIKNDAADLMVKGVKEVRHGESTVLKHLLVKVHWRSLDSQSHLWN